MSRQTTKILSPRQREILNLMADGQTIKEIARTLGISYKTIEAQRWHIFRKMDVKTAGHAVATGFRQGLLA